MGYDAIGNLKGYPCSSSNLRCVDTDGIGDCQISMVTIVIGAVNDIGW